MLQRVATRSTPDTPLGGEWHCIDRVTVAGCQIDQVLVGPGGVFAVETKWTNEPLQLTDTFFDDHAARRSLAHIREGAARLGLELRSTHGARCDVTPLLLLWGPGKPAIETTVLSEGVLVAPGQLLPSAITTQPRTLDAADVQAVADAVRCLATGAPQPAATSHRFAYAG